MPQKLFTFFLSTLLIFVSFAQNQNDSLIIQKIGFKSLFKNNSYNKQQNYYSQLSPKAVPFVQEYIKKQGKELNKMKEWGRPYLDLYDKILTAHGIPKEMKYLSVIESHLRSGLVSWAGAVGPWQIMDYEAKRMGLKLSPIDERTDYTKSTIVAAKLMKELYNQFGDWLLVVAAYNGGAGRVRQAIRLSGSREFWNLQPFLKEETRSHVKKFIGTHYIFEGGGGQTTMTKKEAENEAIKPTTTLIDTATHPLFKNTIIKNIAGRYSSNIAVKYINISLKDFDLLNPNFDTELSAGKKYNLRLPETAMLLFEKNKQAILQDSYQQLLELKN
jgi:membrane-bound lytic murein transglycosylase D